MTIKKKLEGRLGKLGGYTIYRRWSKDSKTLVIAIPFPMPVSKEQKDIVEATLGIEGLPFEVAARVAKEYMKNEKPGES